jgi:hypothetical protein
LHYLDHQRPDKVTEELINLLSPRKALTPCEAGSLTTQSLINIEYVLQRWEGDALPDLKKFYLQDTKPINIDLNVIS